MFENMGFLELVVVVAFCVEAVPNIFWNVMTVLVDTDLAMVFLVALSE
jgi:hypothetical protein